MNTILILSIDNSFWRLYFWLLGLDMIIENIQLNLSTM